MSEISGIARMNIAAMSTPDLRRCHALLLHAGNHGTRRAAVVEAMAEELADRARWTAKPDPATELTGIRYGSAGLPQEATP